VLACENLQEQHKLAHFDTVQIKPVFSQANRYNFAKPLALQAKPLKRFAKPLALQAKPL